MLYYLVRHAPGWCGRHAILFSYHPLPRVVGIILYKFQNQAALMVPIDHHRDHDPFLPLSTLLF
jgi:hypothetical protein